MNAGGGRGWVLDLNEIGNASENGDRVRRGCGKELYHLFLHGDFPRFFLSFPTAQFSPIFRHSVGALAQLTPVYALQKGLKSNENIRL